MSTIVLSTFLLDGSHRYLVALSYSEYVTGDCEGFMDQENVGLFMTKAKERELHGGHISSRDLCWNKSWKLECKCLPALVETFPGEGG